MEISEVPTDQLRYEPSKLSEYRNSVVPNIEIENCNLQSMSPPESEPGSGGFIRSFSPDSSNGEY